MNRSTVNRTTASGIAIILAVAVCTTSSWLALADDRGPLDEAQPASEKPASEAPQGAEGNAGDEAGSDDDVMEQFTRHRPGGCPEGPPCSFED